jgi:hypothetical protein
MQPLARSGWTDTQVDTMLRAGHARIGCRFELLDINLNVVGTFNTATPGTVATVPGTITAAVVEQNMDQKLGGSLTLTMLPDPRLVNQAFAYSIKPYFSIGPMPDGSTIEFAQGVYPWAPPSRDVAPGIEEWNVTLADQTVLLDLAGPGQTGFQAFAGETYTTALARLVQLAGLFDTSGIQNTDLKLIGNRSWGLTRPVQAWGFMAMQGWVDTGYGTYGQQDFSGNWTGQVSAAAPISPLVGASPNPNQTRTTTMLDIASEIHAGIGYNWPWFNCNGRYQAQPFVDWTSARPVSTFGSATNGITITPLHTDFDLTHFANRVFLWNESGDTATFFVSLDANDVVPNHPLAQRQTKRYADRFISQSTAQTQAAAEQQARAELLDGLTAHERVSFDTLAYPVIEPFDVVGVYVANDTEYGSTALFQERVVQLDLFSGVMHHEATAAYQTIFQ